MAMTLLRATAAEASADGVFPVSVRGLSGDAVAVAAHSGMLGRELERWSPKNADTA